MKETINSLRIISNESYKIIKHIFFIINYVMILEVTEKKMRLFRPNITYNTYKDIDLNLLISKNIDTILIDIDNTLAAHDEALPSDEAKAFINKIKDKGINIFTMSNNNEDRVSLFSDALNVKGYSFSLKPLKKTYRKILKENTNINNVAIIGDQLLTDILGGNRMKFITIYTKPLVNKDITFTKFNRFFERFILNILEKKNLLKVGEYYE